MEPCDHEHLARSFAHAGAGPLVQRDYWAVIRDCELAPSRFGALLGRRFDELASGPLMRCTRAGDPSRPLAIGDELHIAIRLSGTCAVRVLHCDDNSLTLYTVSGHPEAGRITFGAYRNADGEVVFHIRSRARSSTAGRYLGWLTIGQAMQTQVWTDLIDRVANTVGRGVAGQIFERVTTIEDPDDDEDAPTFVARGA